MVGCRPGGGQDYLDALRPHLPPAVLADVARVFGDPADFTTMADVVTVHELTHLFHEIHPVTWASEFRADWVMELFANIGMHGYVATHESELLRRRNASEVERVRFGRSESEWVELAGRRRSRDTS